MSSEAVLTPQDDMDAFARESKRVLFEDEAQHPEWSVRGVTFFGWSIKHVALALLVLQNSALILTMHYSRVVPVARGRRYLPSTAVLLVEVIKLVFSLSIALWQSYESYPSQSASKRFRGLHKSIFSSDSWKLVIPAALYTLQNSLVYVAISNLNAATFQVTYQAKILTTVLFSIILLGKKISSRQWLALVLLTVGVAIVQTAGPLSAKIVSLSEIKTRLSVLLSQADALVKSADALEVPDGIVKAVKQAQASTSSPSMNASKGILAVLAASMTSGLTCVYFEKVVKDSLASVSLWTRNVQLSFFSLFPAFIIGVLLQDGAEISRNGFFVGYNWLVWTTIGLQAFGGILVAVCITYADNIAKNFAASISIVTSCIASTMFFDTPLTVNFTCGTAIVLLAVYLYQTRDHSLSSPLLPTDRFDGKKDNVRVTIKRLNTVD